MCTVCCSEDVSADADQLQTQLKNILTQVKVSELHLPEPAALYSGVAKQHGISSISLSRHVHMTTLEENARGREE